MNTAAPRVRVLRGVDPQAADLGAIRANRARQLVVDPALVQSATDDGYRAGYQAGFDAGLLDASDAIEARERSRATDLASTLDNLDSAVAHLRDDHDEIVMSIERRVMAVAVEVAEIIVGHELAITDRPGIEALQRALQFAPQGASATARLHADDIATLGNHRDAFGQDLSIVADASLRRGDCIVDIDSMRIDARIAEALQRVREAIDS